MASQDHKALQQLTHLASTINYQIIIAESRIKQFKYELGENFDDDEKIEYQLAQEEYALAAYKNQLEQVQADIEVIEIRQAKRAKNAALKFKRTLSTLHPAAAIVVPSSTYNEELHCPTPPAATPVKFQKSDSR